MRYFIYLLITIFLASCKNDVELIFENNNGGLFLPDGFQALVVHEGIGECRHIAINKNGEGSKMNADMLNNFFETV